MLRFFVKSQSILLILIWDFSMCAHLRFVSNFAATNYAEVNNDAHHIIFDIGYYFLFFLFPFFRLLADIKLDIIIHCIT